MHIQTVVDSIITKLHNLPGDSAAIYGGLVGGSWAYMENVRIEEYMDFAAHAAIGGIISFVIKKLGDIAYQKVIARKNNTKNEHNR